MRALILLAAALGASACIPARDNPVDPQNLVPPDIRFVQPLSFSCRQWRYPTVEGHVEAVSEVTLSPAERAEIEAHCRAVCPSASDPGETPDAENEDCPGARVIAGSLSYLERTVRCGPFGAEPLTAPAPAPEDLDGDGDVDPLPLFTAEFGFVEQAPGSSDPTALDLLGWGGLDGPPRSFDLEIVDIESNGSVTQALSVLPLSQASSRERFVTTDLIAALPPETRLFTRSLVDVESQRINLTVQSKNVRDSALATCRLALLIDPSQEVAQHPQGISGGYGTHVAIGEMRLDPSPAAARPLEIATTYRDAAGACFVDLHYRDEAATFRTWGRDGNPRISAACGPGGEPPPVAFASFVRDADDGLAFVVDTSGQARLRVLVATSAYDLSLGVEIPYADDGAPSRLASVGDLSGDARDDLAIVGSDEKSFFFCDSGDRQCEEMAMPACQGAPVTRVAAIAPAAFGVVTTSMAVVTQSATRTCVEWWRPQESVLQHVRTDELSGRPPDVTAHWVPREGRTTLVVVGATDAEYPLTSTRELDPALPATRVGKVIGGDCALVLSGEDWGIGRSATSILRYDCPVVGVCRLVPKLAVGVPGFDVPGVSDAGTLAYFDHDACGSGAYRAEPIRFSGVVPVRAGTSVATRIDPDRATRRTRSSSSDCIAPPTTVIGAPGGGAVSAAGHVIVLYERAGASGAPSCVASP